MIAECRLTCTARLRWIRGGVCTALRAPWQHETRMAIGDRDFHGLHVWNPLSGEESIVGSYLLSSMLLPSIRCMERPRFSTP